MNYFDLRTLHFKVWDELGPCDGDVLAEEVAQRLTPAERDAAFRVMLTAYSRSFIGRRKLSKPSLRERLEARSERIGDCLIWRGKVTGNGYGQISMSDGKGPKDRQVHRVSYEAFVGPIPDGHEIDHTCHSENLDACPGRPMCIHTLCWNPDHLRPLLPIENKRLRKGWATTDRTHCRNGHEYTATNTYIPPSAPRARVCRTCRNLRQKVSAA